MLQITFLKKHRGARPPANAYEGELPKLLVQIYCTDLMTMFLENNEEQPILEHQANQPPIPPAMPPYDSILFGARENIILFTVFFFCYF